MRNRVFVLLVSVLACATVAVGLRAGLTRQAAIARKRIGKPLGEDAIVVDRVWRRKQTGDPVDLLLVGDSLAAGLGATHRRETLGGLLAKGLGKKLGRPVRLRSVAVVGSESRDLAGQLDTLGDDRPAVAVIVVGGNDVTHRIPVAESAHLLTEAIARLRDRGTSVVVATCPDLGALRPVPQPLRVLASRLSRRLAGAQANAAIDAGAIPVDLGRTVGRLFFDHPEEMFSLDHFHPSPTGYRRMAAAILPAVVAAIDASPQNG